LALGISMATNSTPAFSKPRGSEASRDNRPSFAMTHRRKALISAVLQSSRSTTI
jgi:hypothetical protein